MTGVREQLTPARFRPRGRLLRIACHYYNSAEDLAALLAALAEYRR